MDARLLELHNSNVFSGDIRSQECLQDKRSFDQLEKVVTYKIRASEVRKTLQRVLKAI